MLSGEVYDGHMLQTMEDGVFLTPPYLRRFVFSTDLSGGHVLGRLQRLYSTDSELRLGGFYDWSKRSDVVFGATWHTVGLDGAAPVRPGKASYRGLGW